MNINLHPLGSLGLKRQIKRQIKALIEDGQLRPDQPLPSARDLAALLGVNRNTTWAAYRELCSEGVLLSRRGKGTFVRQVEARPQRAQLQGLFDRLLSQARELGVSPQEAAELFQDHVLAQPVSMAGRRVLVVECNQETLDRLAGELEQELGAETRRVLIQDLEQEPGLALRLGQEADLVVCGFNHLEEFRRAAPGCPTPSAGVMMAPDRALASLLASLPAGARVGFTCANQRSTENLYKHQVFSKGRSLCRVLVGADDSPALKAMLASCQTVLASDAVYDRVRALAPADSRVVQVEISADRAGLEAVRRALAQVKRAES
ncbi:MAG: GntR family transcriptional regulator [Proteobacteria bacterium]|nr:GntR family transcriptional regulator [Pseudomonadota bacterium]MBU1451385.1 GntR family transcriptional regulator [Pseudomonadota bacterium]MBU2467588.1 GntR family transcriptional regulator [Pseudomonadota bacterium]MBU2519511.1 GntR family transcriptional regulator [Pseudomonadota bacterium]